jgi:hypothetical protein
MADLQQLPANTLQSIALQLGDRIADEFSSAAAAVPPAPVAGEEKPADFTPIAGIEDPASARFMLTETFEVWKLREDATDDLAGTSEDLVTLARSTGAYRHQVKVVQGEAETAVAFAQSYAGAAKPDERVVGDFFFSPLAAQIDRAIELADKLIPEEAIARLLSLPEYKIEALWFVTRPAAAEPTPNEAPEPQPPYSTSRGVIVVSAPTSFAGQTMTLMDSSDFIRALAGTRLGMGLLI